MSNKHDKSGGFLRNFLCFHIDFMKAIVYNEVYAIIRKSFKNNTDLRNFFKIYTYFMHVSGDLNGAGPCRERKRGTYAG